MRRHARLLSWLLVALALAMFALPAVAQPRAWLDREQIAADETVTLNIQTEGVARPDYTPLERDFILSGRSSRSQLDNTGVRTLHAVALRPRRAGRIAILPLRIGNQRTAALHLQVSDASAPAPSRAGDDVFIESAPDDSQPYVQQAVGWVVRLYSAAPLISGQLDQPVPEGASLQQVGDDARYSREIAGRRYEVVERRYLLIPERSGALTIPGASFEGRGTGGFFDELFGDRGGQLSAQAAARALQVQPMPDDAPQPWLPLRDLRLRYATTPSTLREGSAGTLVVEAIADGASAAQMPELQLPPIDGVQVFPEPPQADETFRDGRPRVKVTRRFSLVPSRPGAARLSGMRIGWWDVRSGTARSATLPVMSWSVAGASSTAAAPALPEAEQAAPTVAGNAQGSSDRVWVGATVLFASLWLLTLLWALHARSRSAPAPDTATARQPVPAARTHAADLRRALDSGSLGDVADVLCAMALPPVRTVDELLARLDDAAQREAVEALQQARWGGGDGVRARQQLRAAFAQGPRWHMQARAQPSLLEPLYPP